MTGANHGLGHNTAPSTVRGGGDVIMANRSNAAQAEDIVAEINSLGSEAVAIMRDV